MKGLMIRSLGMWILAKIEGFEGWEEGYRMFRVFEEGLKCNRNASVQF